MRDDVKSTKVTLYEDLPTGISSSFKGANIDSVAFNINYITNKNPMLAKQILHFYGKAKELAK